MGTSFLFHADIVNTPAFGKLETVPDGWMHVEGGVIRGIYSVLPEALRALPVRHRKNAILMPSFSDMHLHAPQYPMLGMGMDLPLIDWLNTYTFATEARFVDPDYARRVYRALAKELIARGTTRVAMFSSAHTTATLILMEELERAGVTGYVGRVNMDRNGGAVTEDTGVSLRETLRWLDHCHFAHIQPILTPRFTPACSDHLMRELGRIAEERGLRVQSHLSENTGEVAWVHDLRPECEGYYDTYRQSGLWRRDTLMAHCVWSDEREMDAMRDGGVCCVHCPTSNVNLSSGLASVRSLRAHGVRVLLGSDIAGGDVLSMNRVAVGAIRVSKICAMQDGGDFLTVPEAFYLATAAGAEYCGAGAGFRVGDPLHAVMVDDSAFPEPVRPLTLSERFERAVYLTEPTHIREVWSEGRCVLTR